jgi:hypothetical protein
MENVTRVGLSLLIFAVIAACGRESPSPTPAVDEAAQPADPLPTPTDTPVPTDPPRPAATATATLAPSSTPWLTQAPEPTEEPGPTQEPEGAPKPADPPRPTDTPAQPAAPRPTPAALPAQEPAPPEVPEELAAYIQGLESAYASFPDAVNTLNGLLGDPRPDDGAWTSAMEAQVFNFKGLYETIRDLEPPQGLEGAHTAIANALGTCNGVADVALEGLRNHDPGLLLRAGDLADACTGQLRGALGLLGEFGVRFEVPAIQVPQAP